MTFSRAAFFSVTPLWEMHNAQFLELVRVKSELGYETFAYHCHEVISHCRANQNFDRSVCKRCIGQTYRNASRLLPKDTINIGIYENRLPDLNSFHIALPKNHDELGRFTFDGFPFGTAAISQLQTIQRESDLSESMVLGKGAQIILGSIKLYEFFIREFEEKQFQ